MKSLPLSALWVFATFSALASSRAFAHEGHGMEAASHWHATDTVGLLAGAVAVALAVWFFKGGK